MKHLKLIASILAMCLLMAGLPAVTAEDLPESEDEIVFSVPFEDVVEEDAEQDIVYGEEVGEEEQTTIEEIELPAEETEVETPEETNRYYASVGEDGAKIYAGATGKEVLGKAYEGNVFLVVGTSGKRAMVAFCIEDAVYEGYIAREKLVELDQEALDNYLDDAIFAKGLAFYDDDVNWPLYDGGEKFAFSTHKANYTSYSNDTIFTIQGKSIKASLVGNQNNCWAYANALYNKIWSTGFASDFTGSAGAGWNMLRNMSDADRKLTVDNLKKYVTAAELGSSLRITSCTSSCSQFNNDGLSCGHKGHTIKTSDHNNEVGCVYITHIYAYDAAGNYCTEAISINVPTPATPAPPTPTPAPPTEAPPTEAPPTEVPPTEAPWDDPTDEQPVPITSDLVEVMPIKPQVYTGGIIEPEPVVLYTGAILTKDFDYTVTYYNNIKIGKATVIIKGIGYFTGMVKKTFKIIPKSVKLTKLSSVNGRLTAVWGRRKSVSGYQLEYSQKRSFSSSTRVTVSGAKTGKKTIKGLKAKKAYYVRIRTYKKVGGKKYYSKWSSAKKIKIK